MAPAVKDEWPVARHLGQQAGGQLSVSLCGVRYALFILSTLGSPGVFL